MAVFLYSHLWARTRTLQIVWDFSDTMNGLMAIPNLICLLVLSNVVAEECFDFQKEVKKKLNLL